MAGALATPRVGRRVGGPLCATQNLRLCVRGGGQELGVDHLGGPCGL